MNVLKAKLYNPVRGQFGHGTALQDKILYITYEIEDKPLSWCFGTDLGQPPTMFLYTNGVVHAAKESAWQYDTNIRVLCGPAAMPDGSMPTDDMELEYVSALLSADSADTVSLPTFYKMAEDVLNKSPAVLITSAVTPAEFTEALESFVSLKTFAHFDNLCRCVTISRQEKDDFLSQKAVVKSIMPAGTSSKISSGEKLASMKAEIWTSTYNGTPLKPSDVFPDVTLQEVLAYAQATGLLPTLVSQRSMAAASVLPMPEALGDGDTIYLGKMVAPYPDRMLIVSHPMKDEKSSSSEISLLYDVSIAPDLSSFSIRCARDLYFVPGSTGKKAKTPKPVLTANSTTTDTAVSVLGALRQAFSVNMDGHHDEIANISGDLIDSMMFSLVTRLQSVGHNPSFRPSGPETWTSDLVSTAKATIDLSSVKDLLALRAVFITPGAQLSSYTITSLHALEHDILAVLSDGNKFADAFDRAKGNKEQMLTKVSEKVELLYTELEPYLKLMLNLLVGHPKSPRPYLLSSRSTGKADRETILASATNRLMHTGPAAANTAHTILPSLQDFQTLMSTAYDAGSYEAMELACSKVVQCAPAGGYQYLQDMMVAVRKVLSTGPPLVNSSTPFPKYLSISRISSTSELFSILLQIALESSIENDTYVSFSISIDRVMRPRDIARAMLEGSFGSAYSMHRSVYA